MRFALFLGCQIPARLVQYEVSARMVLEKLGVELVEIEQFNCCGYPLRNADFKAFLLCAARNLAQAEREKFNLLALCKCCYGSLKKADYLLRQDPRLRQEINLILRKEGLHYDGKVRVKHLLPVLYEDVGLESISEKLERTFTGLKIATHYGCHALRPSEVVQFDDPVSPKIFDHLVEVTGAESVYWPTQLECCGAPLWGINDDLSMDLTAKKLQDGKEAGANYLCTACPYCQLQFDTVQKFMLGSRGLEGQLPSLLYPQLLGLSLGLEARKLGLEQNQLPLSDIEEFFSRPEPEEEQLPQEATGDSGQK